MLCGERLVDQLARLPPEERDRAFEAWLGIDDASVSTAPPGEHLVGYHPAGLAPIVRLLLDVPVNESDVVVDLGSGLGKVAFAAHLLTGAKARGFEIQPRLVDRARATAARFDLSAAVSFEETDARDGDLAPGTIYFLYVPFTGPVLTEVVARLEARARVQPIVVCTLGLDLRGATFLERRRTDAFWLDIYESDPSSTARRPPSSLTPGRAGVIAEERPA